MNQVREKSSFLFKGPSSSLSVPSSFNSSNNSSTLDMNRLTIFQENEAAAAGRGDEQDEDTPRKRMRMTTDDGRQQEEDDEGEEQDTEEEEMLFVHNNSSIAVVASSQYPMHPPTNANLGYVSDLHQFRSSAVLLPPNNTNNLLNQPMKMPTTYKTPFVSLLNNNATNQFPTPPSSSSPVTNGVSVTSTTASSSTSTSQKPPHPLPVPVVPVQVKPILPFSLKIVRFERIGLSEWDIKEIRVFDLQSFLQTLLSNNNNIGGSNDLTIFLLNEKRLHSLLSEKKLSITNSSISISPSACKLEDELTSGYKAVVTSWPQYDFLQLQHFLTSYETHFNSHTLSESSPSHSSSAANNYNSLSLYRFWSQFNETVKTEESSNHSNESDVTEKNGSQASNQSSSNNSIIGYIGYEITIHLVLVVRKNISLGIKTDIWCKIFPNEFLQTSQEIRAALLLENSNNHSNNNNPVVVTFGQILMNFFPQLSFIEKKLQQLNNNNILGSSDSHDTNLNQTMSLTMNDILVKYYSFSSQNKQSETTKANQTTNSNSNSINNNNNLVIPEMVSYQYYQTIGTLQTPANKVMTRYFSLLLFLFSFIFISFPLLEC
jgi:hypothetical protein